MPKSLKNTAVAKNNYNRPYNRPNFLITNFLLKLCKKHIFIISMKYSTHQSDIRKYLNICHVSL